MAKVNIENVDKLIKYIKRLRAEKLIMRDFERQESCGTVACIAGWCRIMNKKGSDYDSYTKDGEKFLGGNPYPLFMFYSDSDFSPIIVNNKNFDAHEFDDLPPKDRKSLIIEALEEFKITNKSPWEKVLKKYFESKKDG